MESDPIDCTVLADILILVERLVLADKVEEKAKPANKKAMIRIKKLLKGYLW